ncbi:MAG: hypothetical protein HKN79_05745 [Flavobacteriales bacterium]|nr:hypothetical protein [Flavobacteriales bacterium]
MKTLYINRHAKSSWKDHSLRDHDRPLNKRGHINAEFMAARFAEETQVDAIISSPAVRALSTARYFAKALGKGENEIQVEPVIYGAGVREMVQLLDQLSDEIQSVIVFGHNPTFTDLAYHLDHSFTSHLVTCARVRIDFEIEEWAALGSDCGKVVYHHYPRMYPEMADL